MKTPEEIANKVWSHHDLSKEETMFDDHWTWDDFLAWIKDEKKSQMAPYDPDNKE